MVNKLETEQKRIEDFMKYTAGIFSTYQMDRLREMGLFKKPASIKHHGKQEGDLYLHSKLVAMTLQEYTVRMELQWKDPRAPIRIGILHDLCKTDDYIMVNQESETVNFSDGRTICVEEDGYYGYNPFKKMPGHGVKSVIMALQLVPELTDEEVMCIRYHMGPWEGKEEWEFVSRAIREYSNITWTMQADLFASQVMGI